MNSQELSFVIKETNRIPYPELIDIMPDCNLGNRLYDSFGGKNGELTAITTYLYQSLSIQNRKEMLMFLQLISKDEMKHLELIGNLICKLGLEPYYMSTYGNKWCSDNVKTNFSNLHEILMNNIDSEKNAINEYEKIINMTQNESIKQLMLRIIMDEKNHIEIFKMLDENYCKKY